MVVAFQHPMARHTEAAAPDAASLDEWHYR